MNGSGPSVALPRPGELRVQRWTPITGSLTSFAVVLLAVLVIVPRAFSANSTQKLTSLLILVLMAVMWNALAGYGGLVSVGQQAFIGIGAYGTIILVDHGMKPYPAMVVAALACGVLAVPISFVVLRLRAAQFAIAMWVVAEVFAILVTFDSSVGGGTGTSLIELNYYTPDQRREYTYWLTLGATAFFLALLFVLLRSRLGAALQAIRDDEEAAASVGVRVVAGKRILFVIAALGCGAAGSLTLANTLFVEPTSIFGVQWTAYMIFMVLVGGLGTFEGPIIGALILFGIQNEFADAGAKYLIGLGLTAILFALFLPRGLWGTMQEKLDFEFMPVGYRLRGALERPRRITREEKT
jgi:branched-chain amino acid transport system permease protein